MKTHTKAKGINLKEEVFFGLTVLAAREKVSLKKFIENTLERIVYENSELTKLLNNEK